MNFNNIIEDIGIYHYALVSGRKSSILASGNEFKEVKENTLKKIKLKGNKLNNYLCIKLKLLKVSDKLIELDQKSKIKKIGGPILVEIIFNQIIEGKIVKLKNYLQNNSIYITNDFLKSKELNKKVLKLICSSANTGKLNNKLFSINIIDDL